MVMVEVWLHGSGTGDDGKGLGLKSLTQILRQEQRPVRCQLPYNYFCSNNATFSLDRDLL